KRSASHHTSPASIASRSVSESVGSTCCAQRKIGLEMKSRRSEVALIEASARLVDGKGLYGSRELAWSFKSKTHYDDGWWHMGVTCGPSPTRHVGVAPAIVNNNPITMKLPRRSFRTLVGCVLSGAQVEQIATPLSLPGLTRQSIHLRETSRKKMDARVKPAHDAARVSSVRIAPFCTIASFAAARAGWSDPCIFLFFCRFGIFHPRSHDLKHTHLLVPAAHFCARGL